MAAGRSSRMGAFKPLLPMGNESFVCRLVRLMRSAGAEQIIVVTGYRAECLREELARENVCFVHNESFAETKMFDSLLLGLSALESDVDRILMSPVDIPLVRPETVRRLLAVEDDFVRPCDHGVTGHPLVLSRRMVERIREYDGAGGLRALLFQPGISVTDVPVDDPGTTMDADTAEDYQKLLAYEHSLSAVGNLA